MTKKSAIRRAKQFAKKHNYIKSWYVIYNKETGSYRAVPQETLSFLIKCWDLDLEIVEEF